MSICSKVKIVGNLVFLEEEHRLTRHILEFLRLDANLVIKVSDFGLTKGIVEEDYYKTDNKKEPLPMRWMSIESILHGVFTTQSDVVCMS